MALLGTKGEHVSWERSIGICRLTGFRNRAKASVFETIAFEERPHTGTIVQEHTRFCTGLELKTGLKKRSCCFARLIGGRRSRQLVNTSARHDVAIRKVDFLPVVRFREI